MSNTLTEVSEAQAETPAAEEISSYSETLVGEGKKFADQEALAKSYYNANLHITEMTDENAELRKNGELLGEVLAELRNDPNNVEAGASAVEPNSSAQPISQSTHVTDDIAKIVDQHISDRDTAATSKKNTDATLVLLTEKYGSKEAALRAVNDAVNGNSAVKRSVDALGNSDPAAAVRFVTNVVPPHGGPVTNTPGVGGNGSAEVIVPSNGDLTWGQCRKVRKEDPARYKSKEFREAINTAAATAENRGEDFFA